MSSIVQGFAKRVPLAEFPEQREGQKGMKAISLDVGDSLVAMHAFTFRGTRYARHFTKTCRATCSDIRGCVCVGYQACNGHEWPQRSAAAYAKQQPSCTACVTQVCSDFLFAHLGSEATMIASCRSQACGI